MPAETKHAGIRTRHRSGCKTREGAACDCRPAFEAWAWDRRSGKKIRRTFPTLTAAKRWRKDAAAQAEAGTMRAPTNLKLREAWSRWLGMAKSGVVRTRGGERFKPSAIRSYEESMENRVLRRFGSARLSALSKPDLQRLVGELQAEGLSASSIRNTLVPLRSLYRDADLLVDGGVSVNPCTGLRLPASKGKREGFADVDQTTRLIAALPERDRALWGCAFYAGLRQGEIRALRWDDVDLASG